MCGAICDGHETKEKSKEKKKQQQQRTGHLAPVRGAGAPLRARALQNSLLAGVDRGTDTVRCSRAVLSCLVLLYLCLK